MSSEKSIQEIYKSYVATGSVKKFMNDIKAQGIQENDPRLSQIAELTKEREQKEKKVDYENFARRSTPCCGLMKKFSERQFVIPNFEKFTKTIEDLYWRIKPNTTGKNAAYIPQLASIPDYWGISICTVDGQRFQIGDTGNGFSIQSCCKPLNYAIACEYLTSDVVHKFIGQEPSGRMFNEMVLDHNNQPHNPMINSGAIATASLIYTLIDGDQRRSMADKFDMVKTWMERAGGNERFGFNNSIYLSEKEVADRNFALGYFMKENKVFPEKTNMLESLDFYFQLCSIETSAETFSVVASTFANGGVCPLTDEKIFSVDTCRDVLSLMHSCGLYDYSGQFSFNVGLPAKSGVSGVIMLVIPNLAGIVCYSPKLDQHGNSVRGIQFCEELLKTYAIHPYDNLRHTLARRSIYEDK
ncbi:glutaminase kidney isoform, mitochondrial-like [Chironomus tepperi]|uniref:glutaminase kidney isoform, mitochondrial-like n=1 Tax=Chironomus tepperi TaxID=113505 RepID=UPI00391F3050